MRSILAVCGGMALPPVLAIALVLAINGGQFAYPLAGPYVHMAMADQILRGHYGITPGVSASPSSTILYPYLLALLAPLHLGVFTSLVPCLAATAGSGLLLALVAEEAGVALGALGSAWLFLFGVTISLALNFVGLTLAGLEHAPHVFLTLASLLGLLRFVRRRKADWWWLASIVLLPLIRFEGVAAVLADVLVLLAFRKWWHALGVIAATALLVGGFGFYLMSLGLPFLPESVIDRSLVAGTVMQFAQAGLGGMLRAVYANTRVNLLAYGGVHILAALILSAWGAARGIRDLPRSRVQQAKLVAAGFLAVVGLAQIFAGSLVSISRYEIYVLALGLGALLVAFAVETNALLVRLSLLGRVGLCLSILVLGAGYALRAVDAVKGARDMQLLDGTLARFIVEVWREPVAVTRYGRLSWRNPWVAVPVQLDEPGSLSEEVDRKAEALVAQHGIRLAVLDATSTAPVPGAWEKVAELRLPGGGPLGSNLYAVHPEDRAAITKALQRFWEALSTAAVLRLPPKVAVLRD